MMDNLDFAETVIMDIIAIPRIITAITPNSGITNVPTISIVSAPAGNDIVIVLSVDVVNSLKFVSYASTNTKTSASSPFSTESNIVRGIIKVTEPSPLASIDIINECDSTSGVMLSTSPPLISYPTDLLESATLRVPDVAESDVISSNVVICSTEL